MRTPAHWRLALLCVALLGSAVAGADTYLNWYTVDDGGAMFTVGGPFELSGTIGQPDASVASMTGGGLELTGGFWVAAVTPNGCPGDANCDGRVDFADINPFIDALINGVYCDGTGENADLSNETPAHAGFEDINPFVDLLTRNPLPILCR